METFGDKGVTLHISLDWWVLCLFMENWCKRFTLCIHRGYFTLVENLIHIWNNFSEAVNSSIVQNSDSYQASYSSRLIITLVELTVSGFLSQVYIFDVTRILISRREFSFCQSCFHWRFTWRDSIKIGFYSQQERNISKWRKYQWSWFFLNTYIPFSYSVSGNLMIHILLLL